MARGRKQAAAPPGAVKLDRLTGLVGRIEAAKSVNDDARSDLGNIYKEADDMGFNRQALKMAVKLRNMEPEKRNDYLSSLQAYCDFLGVWTQGSLFGEDPQVPSPPADSNADHAEQTASAVAEVGSFNWESGRLAAHEGKTADENPWGLGVKAHDSWEAGRATGEQEIADGLADAPANSNGGSRRRKPKDAEQPAA